MWKYLRTGSRASKKYHRAPRRPKAKAARISRERGNSFSVSIAQRTSARQTVPGYRYENTHAPVSCSAHGESQEYFHEARGCWTYRRDRPGRTRASRLRQSDYRTSLVQRTRDCGRASSLVLVVTGKQSETRMVPQTLDVLGRLGPNRFEKRAMCRISAASKHEILPDKDPELVLRELPEPR